MQAGGLWTGAGFILLGGWAIVSGWGWYRWRRSAGELERALLAVDGGRPFRARRQQLTGPMVRVSQALRAILAERDEQVARREREVEQLRVVLGGWARG